MTLQELLTVLPPDTNWHLIDAECHHDIATIVGNPLFNPDGLLISLSYLDVLSCEVELIPYHYLGIVYVIHGAKASRAYQFQFELAGYGVMD